MIVERAIKEILIELKEIKQLLKVLAAPKYYYRKEEDDLK